MRQYISNLNLFSNNYEIINGISIPYDRDREMFPETDIMDAIFLIRGFNHSYRLISDITWEDIKEWILR